MLNITWLSVIAFACMIVNHAFIPIKPTVKVNIRDKRQFNNTKYITITPGGIAGFYSLGVCNFIKEEYDISDYSFLGASAGAWNAMVCSYKGNTHQFIKCLFEDSLITDTHTVDELQYNLKQHILARYDLEDFDVNRLHITICEVSSFCIKSNVINSFNNLDTLLDCCIVSSHIPYITSGSLIKVYDNKITFDGGLLSFPPKDRYHHMIVSPNMYDPDMLGNMLVSLFKRNITKDSLYDLFIQGYTDASLHKEDLDEVFLPENNYINIEDNEFDIIPW